MKRLILLVMLIVMYAFAINVEAAPNDYTVALDTYAVVGDTSTWPSGAWPNIAGNGRITHIVLSNSGDTVQTVDFYDTTSATGTLTSIMPVVLATTGTTIIPYDNDRGVYLPFTGGLIIKKSATGSTVNVTIIYR